MTTDSRAPTNPTFPPAGVLEFAAARLSAGQLREALLHAFERMNAVDREATLDHVHEIAARRRRRTKNEVTASIVEALSKAGYDYRAIARIADVPERHVRSLMGLGRRDVTNGL